MTQIFPHLIPEVADWPVAKQSKDRANFIKELDQFVEKQVLETNKGNLYDLISKSIYLENQRIKLNPWKVDPPDEKLYWKNISAELEVSVHSEEREERELNLLKKIIHPISMWNFHLLINILTKVSGDGAIKPNSNKKSRLKAM